MESRRPSSKEAERQKEEEKEGEGRGDEVEVEGEKTMSFLSLPLTWPPKKENLPQ